MQNSSSIHVEEHASIVGMVFIGSRSNASKVPTKTA